MSNTVKNYILVLDDLLGGKMSERELAKRIEGFITFVAARNDAYLLTQIVAGLEKKLRTDGRLVDVFLEFGQDVPGNERVVDHVVSWARARNTDALVRIQTRLNPGLGSGVRAYHGEGLLLDVSFGGMLHRLFS